MSFLSNLIKQVAPIVATVAPGTPIGTAAAVVTYGQAKQEQSYQRKLAEEAKSNYETTRRNNMPFGDPNAYQPVPVSRPSSIGTSNAGFGSSFGSFLSDVGTILLVLFQVSFLKLDHLFLNNLEDNPPSRQERILADKKVNPRELQKVLLVEFQIF